MIYVKALYCVLPSIYECSGSLNILEHKIMRSSQYVRLLFCVALLIGGEDFSANHGGVTNS